MRGFHNRARAPPSPSSSSSDDDSNPYKDDADDESAFDSVFRNVSLDNMGLGGGLESVFASPSIATPTPFPNRNRSSAASRMAAREDRYLSDGDTVVSPMLIVDPMSGMILPTKTSEGGSTTYTMSSDNSRSTGHSGNSTNGRGSGSGSGARRGNNAFGRRGGGSALSGGGDIIDINTGEILPTKMQAPNNAGESVAASSSPKKKKKSKKARNNSKNESRRSAATAGESAASSSPKKKKAKNSSRNSAGAATAAAAASPRTTGSHPRRGHHHYRDDDGRDPHRRSTQKHSNARSNNNASSSSSARPPPWTPVPQGSASHASNGPAATEPRDGAWLGEWPVGSNRNDSPSGTAGALAGGAVTIVQADGKQGVARFAAEELPIASSTSPSTPNATSRQIKRQRLKRFILIGGVLLVAFAGLATYGASQLLGGGGGGDNDGNDSGNEAGSVPSEGGGSFGGEGSGGAVSDSPSSSLAAEVTGRPSARPTKGPAAAMTPGTGTGGPPSSPSQPAAPTRRPTLQPTTRLPTVKPTLQPPDGNGEEPSGGSSSTSSTTTTTATATATASTTTATATAGTPSTATTAATAPSGASSSTTTTSTTTTVTEGGDGSNLPSHLPTTTLTTSPTTSTSPTEQPTASPPTDPPTAKRTPMPTLSPTISFSPSARYDMAHNHGGCDAEKGERLMRLILYDSWGDGWSNTVFKLGFQDTPNQYIVQDRLDTGKYRLEYLCLERNMCYTVSVGGGAWEAEVAWEIRPTAIGVGYTSTAIATGLAPMDCTFSFGVNDVVEDGTEELIAVNTNDCPLTCTSSLEGFDHILSDFPTAYPTKEPTASPSSIPSLQPTSAPTSSPSTPLPTSQPSSSPSSSPSGSPSSSPSSSPTGVPSASPTSSPSSSPSSTPSSSPSVVHSSSPSTNPTVSSQPSSSQAPSIHSTSQAPSVWYEPNDEPADPEKTYFNYDPNSEYGPSNWNNVNVKKGSDNYWHRFTDLKESTFKNTCGAANRQSPIDLCTNPTDHCDEFHEIRPRPGDFLLDDGNITKQILHNKLRLVYADRTGEEPDPPLADFAAVSSKGLDMKNIDIHIPSEHTLCGNRYHAEMQYFYNHVKQRYLIAVSFLINADHGNPDNDHIQELIDEFQKLYDLDEAACNSSKRKARALLMNTKKNQESQPRIRGGVKQNNDDGREKHTIRTALSSAIGRVLSRAMDRGTDRDPERRKLQRGRNWNPFDYSIQRSVHFWGYEGSLTEPPCSKGVAWRVMDVPALISPRQLEEMKNLIFNHVDPQTCKKTSTHHDNSVARPIQTNTIGYYKCTRQDYTSDEEKDMCGKNGCTPPLGVGLQPWNPPEFVVTAPPSKSPTMA